MKSQAPLLFRNRHINTIFGNNGPRKWVVGRRAEALNAASHPVILDCRNGVQLHGLYTQGHDAGRGLVVLLHGWEGTAWSTYLQSLAVRLMGEGYSVFRLHMRDHGPTHHLNHDPFLAIRLDEILDALEQICAQFPHDRTALVGFSLGANMAVRVAANIGERPIHLDRVIAASPPIDPEAAAVSIRSYQIYNRYFISKWQRSFERKIELFADYRQHADLLKHTDILEMHDDFIPRFCEHENAASYFRAYALSEANIAAMDVPCHIVMVKDDPVIPIDALGLLPKRDGLSHEIVDDGGHCGFVNGYRLTSWFDDKAVAMLSRAGF
ncbi:alpha/beta fold hydrolase [Cohaesibacter sp. CAU 1516]|uniref:YheT family hydrolase n=1 Tax=Cohaesibacter sp. CAU 1516 TaxID=2576038 RepID=UPI0010FDB89A|nr:alpha/beta fold hydrolase [Cohaesibacter sp. CAU 1516]TLP46878.1 alpha/beta fold hydrolase [Cohaesibacter sp. CAU 1516]